MGFLNKKEDTNVECHVCHGNGIDNTGRIRILSVCKKCNGHGWVDWVAGAVKGSTHKPNVNKDMLIRVAHQNIHLLRHQIIDIGMDAGFRLTVNIEAMEIDQANQMMKTAAHHINLGGNV